MPEVSQKEPYPILHKIAEAWGEDLKTVERRYERGLFDSDKAVRMN